MRGLSTVAAFAIFIVVFAIFVATAIYYYQLLRQTTTQAVQEVRSAALPPDQQGALIYNGTCVFSAAGSGSPFAYYLEVAAPTGQALTSSRVYPSLAGAFEISCPPGPGLYKYIGVRQNGQLAYLYVYVGPSVAWVAANGTVAYVSKVGDGVAIQLYLNVYNNSTGWLPATYNVALLYDSSKVVCNPSTFSVGPTALSPGEQRPIYLGVASCRAVGAFNGTTIKAVVVQSYGAYSWSGAAAVVVELVNSSSLAASTSPPPSGVCSFTPVNGSQLSGFNQMNGWIGAWGGGPGGYVVAVRPGLLVPAYATGGSGFYYVQLSHVEIGSLIVSQAPAAVQISGPMPAFLSSLKVYTSAGTLYVNGSGQAVQLQPGTYTIYVDVRASPNAAPGSTASLYLSCGSYSYPIAFEIPQWTDWGIPVKVYQGTNLNTYAGTWSVGSIYFWLTYRQPPLSAQSPYFTIGDYLDSAPQWAAALLNPTASRWDDWSLDYTGTLYVPWNEFRVGVWHDDGVRVYVCGNLAIDYWNPTSPRFDSGKVRCSSNKIDVEVQYFEGYVESVLMFVVGPKDKNVAYMPTIDGAWYCSNFNWGAGIYGSGAGTCNTAWTFVPWNSQQNQPPYWIVNKYSPGSKDGAGVPSP
ncbi:hypothetical protein TUZN_0902 [Thermoproteus uzoniensis 768-20]|uniref:PA14 domain-containing protein n=1 Tax=Thermoproteus uzoniensis (strain 768-20) TaxID=999630 RepID=F2L5L5_THEU7|nr:hypothetical protein [Thermoproteus uzoniensis]AEA12386.1 hypothetical protein TUZN_0902 [Thermoproteus uzoniensis 768-20]